MKASKKKDKRKKSKKISDNAAALGELKQQLVDRLHDYNDLKDATQVVLGSLAVAKGLPIKDMYRKYDLPYNET